jgi:hypothetical protein
MMTENIPHSPRTANAAHEAALATFPGMAIADKKPPQTAMIIVTAPSWISTGIASRLAQVLTPGWKSLSAVLNAVE